jgi:hypothetical protein
MRFWHQLRLAGHSICVIVGLHMMYLFDNVQVVLDHSGKFESQILPV